MPPAAPVPQSRGTTGIAATTVVPAARQTGINTHRDRNRAAAEVNLYSQELD